MSLPPTRRRRRCREFIFLCVLLLAFLEKPLLAQAPPFPEDSVLFREGEILFSKGEMEKALWRFRRLTVDFPQSSLYHEARFRMAVCYTRLKRPKDAIQVLNDLFSTFLSPGRMIQVFTLLGDNHVELADPLTALHWYGKGLFVSGQPQEELRNKVRSIIDTFTTEKELGQVESLYRGAYGGGYAKLKMALMARQRGDDVLARKLLLELEKEYRGMDYSSQMRELLESIPAQAKSKYTIGVILPLSGTHQSFGERALQGIQLAVKEADPGGSPSLISLAVRDSKGNPHDAERAVEELVTKEKAIAIIGPLLSVNVDRAARKAQQLRVPLLSLSQKELPSGKGDFIFQNSFTPSAQVQSLVTYAIRDLELRTFAVFYPNSPYGLHFKNLFAQEVVQRGGKTLGAAVYQEDQTDFSQEIRSFFRVETLTRYDSGNKKIEEFKPGLSVDGLFIPDTYDRVGLLLSQMAYYDVKDPVFMGTNGWNSPGLISTTGTASDGSIFVDAFFKGSPSPMTARFVEEFRKLNGRDPETLEALAYEGARFLKEILGAKSISSPIQLRDEIHQIQNFQGISNLRGFGEGGKPIRTLTILRVNKGKIEQVRP